MMELIGQKNININNLISSKIQLFYYRLKKIISFNY